MIYDGGFSHSDVYSLPVYLKNFYIQKYMDWKKAEKDAMEKSNNSMSNPKPNFNNMSSNIPKPKISTKTNPFSKSIKK